MRTVEGPSPIVDRVRNSALEWFTGKARMNASEAFDLLADSEAASEWIPGASRRVAAALTKSNVALKLERRYRAELEALGDYQTPRDERGFAVSFLLQFSDWKHGRNINFDAIKARTRDASLTDVIEAARTFTNNFTPLVDLIATLDATRPTPIITSIGASPTITQLLRSLGLLVNIETIRMPRIEWITVEHVDKDGKKFLAKVGCLNWPKNTIHGASRYAGTEQHEQCQACGHAIRNPYNWVPILIDGDKRIPHSLWVGKDCAKTLFGIDVKGDLELIE